MVANFEGGSGLIESWLRNKNTIDFLGVWERINNPNFNSPDFKGIKSQAGLNRFSLSVKQWSEKVNGIGIIALLQEDLTGNQTISLLAKDEPPQLLPKTARILGVVIEIKRRLIEPDVVKSRLQANGVKVGGIE